jgi:preprotein translocase subunit SecD
MPGTWWTRFGIIVSVLLWGCWNLFPTIFIEQGAAAAAQEQADGLTGAAPEEEALDLDGDGIPDEPPDPWYQFLVSDARLNLGLDLVGGIDLTLAIEVDEAVQSVVAREVRPVREQSSKDGVGLRNVRRSPGETIILVEPEDGVTQGVITKFMQERFDSYEYLETRTEEERTWLAYALTELRAEEIRSSAVKQALETLRNRIDETGVKEPSIVLRGGNEINVQLPGEDNVEQAVNAIGTQASLEFMMVDHDAMKDQTDLNRGLEEAERKLPSDQFMDDRVLSDWLVTNRYLQSGQRLMFEYVASREGGDERHPDPRFRHIVKDEVLLTGDDVNNAQTAWDGKTNEPYVGLDFKPAGAKKFGDLTAENVGRNFAIILDGRVQSAPRILTAIRGGRASITMGQGDMQYLMNEASTLALVLRTGALPAPVSVTSVRVVGASLGQDAIEAGQKATVVGFGLVLLFMVVYYKRAGIISVIALVCNMLLVMALLSVAGATLTLPGIAGIALTIGMAVDCNIIIYERIREELRLGKNSRAAADAGFEKALWAVLDANITTFIAGVVLYTYGTGPIKGFAVTLMIGIITTLFTGIFVSRTLMDLLTRRASARLSI